MLVLHEREYGSALKSSLDPDPHSDVRHKTNADSKRFEKGDDLLDSASPLLAGERSVIFKALSFR
jgi:hypothetical protein